MKLWAHDIALEYSIKEAFPVLMFYLKVGSKVQLKYLWKNCCFETMKLLKIGKLFVLGKIMKNIQ